MYSSLFRNIVFLLLFNFQNCDKVRKTHSITDKNVKVHEFKYNRSQDFCFVSYTLDGPLGPGLFKSIMPTINLDGDLQSGHLPPGVVAIDWVDDRMLKIAFNSKIQDISGNRDKEFAELLQKKDTVKMHDITLVVSERIYSR